MNNRFKCRAKDTLTNVWRYGHYAYVKDNTSPTGGYHVIYEEGKPYIIQLNTLCQCTGICDTSNFKDIYENDFVEGSIYHEESKLEEFLEGVVVYEPSFAGFGLKDENGKVHDLVMDVRYIKGNIFDN